MEEQHFLAETRCATTIEQIHVWLSSVGEVTTHRIENRYASVIDDSWAMRRIVDTLMAVAARLTPPRATAR